MNGASDQAMSVVALLELAEGRLRCLNLRSMRTSRCLRVCGGGQYAPKSPNGTSSITSDLRTTNAARGRRSTASVPIVFVNVTDTVVRMHPKVRRVMIMWTGGADDRLRAILFGWPCGLLHKLFVATAIANDRAICRRFAIDACQQYDPVTIA